MNGAYLDVRSYEDESGRNRTGETILCVEGLRVARRGKGAREELLSGVSFGIRRGARVGIVGESGSGKSLTATAIVQLLPNGLAQTSGKVIFEGRDLASLSEREMHRIRGGKIGMIFQNVMGSLNPLFPVGKQIAAVARTHLGMSRKRALEHAVAQLEELGVPSERARDYPYRFSGGMAQRVAIAMAMCCSPSLLIADEPTTGLDATIQLQVLEAIDRRVRNAGCSLLLISHDLAIIAAMTDWLVVMYAGVVLEAGPTADVMEKPLSPYTRKLVECARPSADGAIQFIPGHIPEPGTSPRQCVFSDRCDLVYERCRRERPELRLFEGGRQVSCHAAGQEGMKELPLVDWPAAEGGKAVNAVPEGNDDRQVLKVCNLSKKFAVRSSGHPFHSRMIPAVDGVSFTIRSGSTTAVVGESGSGKSTLARLIVHLYRPDSGEIYLLGRRVDELSNREFRAYRRHVQMVFQNPWQSFDPMFSLARSISEVQRLGREGEEASVGELLEEVGLPRSFADRRPIGISGGELQRAALARALAARSELIVLDEPTSALDISIRGQVLTLLQSLQERRGLSYLIATHDLGVVRSVAHEVLVMYLGQLVEVAPTRALFEEASHPYTLGLLDAERVSRDSHRRIRLQGSIVYPDPGYVGCRLVGRCPLATDRCRERQQLVEMRMRHWVRCWRAIEGDTLAQAKREVGAL